MKRETAQAMFDSLHEEVTALWDTEIRCTLGQANAIARSTERAYKALIAAEKALERAKRDILAHKVVDIKLH